jgi:hypothetical protein
MTEVARWKTIATIAIAFSAGNLFATACDTSGGGGGLMGEANAEEEQDISGLVSQVADLATALASTEAAVAALQDDVSDIKCVLRLFASAEHSGTTVDVGDATDANFECGI